MKFIDPRDSNLEIQSKISSDRKHSKLQSLGIVGIAVTSAIVVASAMTSLVQAQSTNPPAKPFDAGACPSDTNAAITSQGMKNHSMMMSGMMSGMMTGDFADRHFIEMTISHHDGAVKMADLVLKRSRNPEIRQLAEAIKRDQTLEIAQIQTWYKEWYKADIPEIASRPMQSSNHMMGMNGGKMGMGNMMATDLKMLETAKDSDFDKEFLAEMIPHHKMALMMSNMIVDSDRPQIRKLAQNILRSQSQEIDQMRGWYSNIR